MRRRLIAVLATFSVLSACQGKGGMAPTVKVAADSASLVSGNTTAVTAMVTRNNNPVASMAVTFTAGSCGTMPAGSVTTPGLGGIGGRNPGEAPSTFTGNSPTATCVDTITATAGSGTGSTTVTVTPKPIVVTAVSSGAGTTGAVTAGYTVELTPNVIQVSKGFSATYAIKSNGSTIVRIALTLDDTGSVTTSNTTTNAYPSALVGSNMVVEERGAPNPTTETLTLKSDKTHQGTATIDVILNSGVGAHVDHATFSGLPGPKK